MTRSILMAGLVAAMMATPIAAFAQQAVMGDSVETYSDTLPKHHATAKRQIALNTSSRTAGSKSYKGGGKGGKSHKLGKGHHGRKGTA